MWEGAGGDFNSGGGTLRCGQGLGGMVNNKLGGPLYGNKNF